VVLKLPSGWGTRVQTLSVQTSANGSTFSTVVNSAGYTFDPALSNTVTIPLPNPTNARYVRINITANTGWPAGQCSEFQVWSRPGTPGDTQPPTAPGNLTSPAKTATSVSLAWTASTDNVGVFGYQVRQAGTVVGSTSTTSFTVTNLTPSTPYTFRVTAVDAANNVSSPSNAVTVTTNAAGDTQAPSAPTNLTSPAKTTTSVSLAWTASTDNVGVTGYQVRQAGSVVGTTAGTSFTVNGLNPNTAYTFTVTAQDAAGNTSAPSNALSVTTSAAPNTNLALGKPTAESSHTETYGSGNVVDGNASSYWESANNAFPQWVQVDLGAATAVSRVVVKLPPASSWATRTQTFSVQGSTNGSTFTTLAPSTGRTFNPATGNTVTVTFTSTSTRYVRLNFTANTGWPAGQCSEFEVYAS
jgi:chitodextrinase